MSWNSNPMRGWLCDWLGAVAKQPPPADITALYLGLFEGEEGYRVYMTGAKCFDPNDDDWAGTEDWCPGEENRYAPGAIGDGEANGRRLSPRHAQTLFAMQMGQLIECGEYDALFKGRAVAAGFDDGGLTWLREK